MLKRIAIAFLCIVVSIVIVSAGVAFAVVTYNAQPVLANSVGIASAIAAMFAMVAAVLYSTGLAGD